MTNKKLFAPVFHALREFENLCGEDRTDAEAADKASEVLTLLKDARQRAELHIRTHPTGDTATTALKRDWLPIIRETRQDVLQWL